MQHASALLLPVNKLASELSDKSLLTVVNSKGHSVEADGLLLHVQCEHINCELWLYIAASLVVQCELKSNNIIYKIIQCMPSLRGVFYCTV